jgi:hypothetical protein
MTSHIFELIRYHYFKLKYPCFQRLDCLVNLGCFANIDEKCISHNWVRADLA